MLLNQPIARAYYNPFPDTLYSCEPQLKALTGFSRYSINDVSVAPSSDPDQWYTEPPSCYAEREKGATDDIDQMACEEGWCATLKEKPHHEVCSPTLPVCRAYIDEDDMRTKVEKRFYWNLHVFPKIVFHPRNHTSGRIMTEISLTEPEAIAKRQEAAGHPDQEALKPYLNPVLDDSASAYFSGQFVAPENPATTWSISLSIPPASPGATSFAHDPPIMFRIPRMPGAAALDRNSADDLTLALQQALLRPFAKDAKDDAFVADLDQKCPFWKIYDDAVGKRTFSIRTDVQATLPDDLPTDPYDTRWKTTEVQGNRTYLKDARTLDNQVAIVRNKDVLYSDFWWKGCPITEELFGMTKKQLVDFLSEPLPTCNLEQLSQAQWRIYTPILYRFWDVNEERERRMALKRIEEIDFHLKRIGDRIYQLDYSNCPETHLSSILKGAP